MSGLRESITRRWIDLRPTTFRLIWMFHGQSMGILCSEHDMVQGKQNISIFPVNPVLKEKQVNGLSSMFYIPSHSTARAAGTSKEWVPLPLPSYATSNQS